MTFSLTQSPSNIFVFPVLHFTTYALLGITLNLSDLIHFLLLKKKILRNYFLSNSIVCTQEGVTPNLHHQTQPALITATKATSTSEWCFPRDGNQSQAQLQEKGDPVQSILLLPFHFQQLCVCCSICDPVGGRELCPPGISGPAPPLLETGDASSLQHFPRNLACEEFQPWLSMSKAAERESGTLPLECISHSCVRRVWDLHHSRDIYLYTFLNTFI